MKLGKRICTGFIIFCLIIVNVNFSYAQMSNTSLNTKANILTELNILKGNGESLDLDGELSRSQAAAFIVRLLCEEKEVLDNKDKYNDTNFSDVSKGEWFTPYISYCVKNNIIDGYSDNTFRPNDKLGEKAFLKLVLTALGYKYNEDFTWSNVFEFAYGVNLVKDISYTSGHKEDTNYTRGKVVDILYTSLQLKNTKTKTRMIQKFVDNMIITKEKALTYNLLDDKLETDITSVEATSEITIEVTFNEPVQNLTPENILLYETVNVKTLTINNITRKESTNTYVIQTSEPQNMDVEYTLLIDKVIDNNGNSSNSFNRTLLGFRADEVKSDYFKISKIEPVSKNIVYVYFTQPINDNALQTSFYTILQNDSKLVEGNNSNMLINKLSTCDNGISIYLKNYVFSTQEYFKLSIDGNMSSNYGVLLNDGEGDSVKFKSSVEDNATFEAEGCISINSRTIELKFNKEVNPVLAKQIYNYSITDENKRQIRVTNANVINDGNNSGRVVQLTIDENLMVNKQYNVLVNYLTDITRQFSIIEKQYSFICTNYGNKDIDIDAVISTDDNTLILYISDPVDQQSAQIVSNYQIQGITNRSFVAIPSGAYYNNMEDSSLIKIYLPKDKKLIKSHIYNFRILTSLKDSMGNYQSSIKNYRFTHNVSKSMDTYISEAKVIGENTIKLSFNREIAFNINNVLNTNYSLTYTENGLEYNKIPITANYIDPTTIILKFDVIDKEKEYNIRYKKLIDYGNNETINLNNKYSTKVIYGE
ncbi:S-layer homology domain-containing protein [Vallitalea guaymasensis]|uniref:S-layer homology domain-containing protein n=1 Tax=Vallitalea guaymasensis TaxID=1185412 RepID=A0A8J8SBX8_9FIRM|nr:S-layer homology domain-containing protein [Vallitalea guaymasensis]QUH29152.1 S-layer homology domain-containing protein [Vallitalea guaymasensis]